MDLNKVIELQYVEWKVKTVMHIKNNYGFRVVLIMSDGTERVQQKSGFKTKSEANNARNNVIAELTDRRYIVFDKVKVSEYMVFWLETIMKPDIANNSYVSYKNSIDKYIIPNLGNMYLTNINRGHLIKLFKKIYSITKSGVDIARTVLKTSFDFAIYKNLMNNNPVLNVSLKKELKTYANKVKKIDTTKTLTLEQVKILVEASVDSKIHMQILFAALMGLRRGEINGLKYSDIDYINRKIKIQRQLGIKPNSKKEDFSPKTYTKQEIVLKTDSSERELDIPDYVFEEILKERKKYEKTRNRWKNYFQDLDYICCSLYGRPRSKSYASTHFKKLLKDNNLPDIRWHDLRATYATILLKNNHNPKAVSKLLGHSKEIITVDVYGDKQKIIEDCLEELEPFIDEVIPKEEIEYDFSEDYEYINIIENFIHNINVLSLQYAR